MPSDRAHVRHQTQHFIRRSDHDGQKDECERDAARISGKMSCLPHDQFVDEQPDDNRGRAEKDVVDEPDHFSNPGSAGVLGQKRPSRDADGTADRGSDQHHDETSEEGIQQTAALPRRRCHLSDELQIQGIEPLDKRGTEDPKEPNESEDRGEGREGQYEETGKPTAALTGPGENHVTPLSVVRCAGASVSLPQGR